MAKAKEKAAVAKAEAKAQAEVVAPEEVPEEVPEESLDEPQAEAEEKEPKKPSNELKIVITLKDDRAIVGLQSPDCDPIFTTVEGGLPAVTKQLPKLIKDAKAKWATAPQNPEAKLPEPPAPPPAPRRAAPAPREEPAQPSMF
jgi:hypothetical protein